MFVVELLHHPFRVGAVLPSGKQLANKMTSSINASNAPVVEFGPGTGVLTQRLLDRGVSETELVLVERSSAFAECLRQKFPRAQILHGDARLCGRFGQICGQEAGAYVSGLPLRWFSNEVVMQILKTAFDNARNGSEFYQYSYLPWSPVSRENLTRLGLKIERVGTALWNLPPAFVFRISKTTQ